MAEIRKIREVDRYAFSYDRPEVFDEEYENADYTVRVDHEEGVEEEEDDWIGLPEGFLNRTVTKVLYGF